MNPRDESNWPFYAACVVVACAAALLTLIWDADWLTIVQVAALVMVVVVAPRVLHKGQHGVGATMVAAALLGCVFMATLCYLDFGWNYIGFSIVLTLLCATGAGFGGIFLALAVAVAHWCTLRVAPENGRANIWDNLIGGDWENRAKVTIKSVGYATLLIACGLAAARAFPAPTYISEASLADGNADGLPAAATYIERHHAPLSNVTTYEFDIKEGDFLRWAKDVNGWPIVHIDDGFTIDWGTFANKTEVRIADGYYHAWSDEHREHWIAFDRATQHVYYRGKSH